MHAKELELSSLLLDPNNYRVQDNESFLPTAPERFHLDRVQSGALARLKEEGIRALRNSFVANGFLPIERIVVTPYEHEQGKYLVIEGNRRVAALRQVQSEHEAGVDIPASLVDTFKGVPCIVVENDGSIEYFKETLMGVRHVGGILEWGGFQRAKLIADLRDIHEVELGDIGQKLGLTANEVNRRYRAYKALEQMQGDEEFADLATAKLYPLFHEAVSIPIVRDWLGWSPEEFSFTAAEPRENFYRLITPQPYNDEGTERGPKINTYLDVRALREILGNPEAKADLLDLERSIADALSIAKTREKSKRWRVEVADARTALNNIGALEVQKFTADDRALIRELADTAEAILAIKAQSSN